MPLQRGIQTQITHTASDRPSVSVVIPAYNASRWIARTIQSVQEQTVTNIEVIVVDDGSTDDTAEIACRAINKDPRIILLQQPNGGVASARNAGIAAARSEFIALLDADDLWHPERLKRHLEVFSSEVDDVALVYSPHVRLDHSDCVISSEPFMVVEGYVFERHLCTNFIGTGSAITIRTSVARDIGGYSTELRTRGAQGYEDWLFQLKVAYSHKFRCVPLYLIGYRETGDNMSSDSLAMRLSGVEAIHEIKRYAIEVARPLFWWAQARAVVRLSVEYLKRRRWNSAVQLLIGEVRRNPVFLPYLACFLLDRVLSRLRSWTATYLLRRKSGRVFSFGQIDPADVCYRSVPLAKRLCFAIHGYVGSRRLRYSKSQQQ